MTSSRDGRAARPDLARLRTALTEHVEALTDAVCLGLLLHDAATGTWTLQPDGRSVLTPVDVDAPECARLVPLAAFHHVLDHRQTLLVDDAAHDGLFADDPWFAAASPCPRSVIAVPVLQGCDLRAVLVLGRRVGAPLDDAPLDDVTLDDVALVAGLLADLDGAVRRRAPRAAAHSPMSVTLSPDHRRSATDPLTGVASRRRFNETWLAEWERGRLNGWPLAVMVIDVDDFQEYGDALGPIAGATCLQTVATTLVHSVRDSDLVCRYGGQEFAIILPRAGLFQATAVAQRAHAAVRALDLHHPGDIGRVTVSIGVAAHVPDGAHLPEQLLATADAALHEARHSGRDQVVTRSPDLLEDLEMRAAR